MSDTSNGPITVPTLVAHLRDEIDAIIGEEVARLADSAAGPGAEATIDIEHEPPPQDHRAGGPGRDQAEAQAETEDDDAGRRLDALALRLEGRLRRARGRPGERSAIDGDNNGDDTPTATEDDRSEAEEAGR